MGKAQENMLCCEEAEMGIYFSFFSARSFCAHVARRQDTRKQETAAERQSLQISEGGEGVEKTTRKSHNIRAMDREGKGSTLARAVCVSVPTP